MTPEHKIDKKELELERLIIINLITNLTMRPTVRESDSVGRVEKISGVGMFENGEELAS